ncbi:ras-related protein rab-21 [Plakobranchus ocellatus]|uniref:Ras-related protein rab-21 n=1 Tax=Plakobranchus ocellatus TaxID=259542 RepID=A0AAV3ZU35_9GAST|nr:ras-related protein rab-21 [Plakobranchus ocellatus]
MKSLEAKVVVLGSQGVGKTSVVIRYVGGMFSKAVSPTIGASFFTYKMTLEQYRVKLQVWDTAGQERFRSMAPMYYRKANAAMLVYDITSLDSFYDIKDWVKELKKNVDTPIVLCLLGNKSDLENGRKVSKEDAEEYAASIDALFYETSALKNMGIEDAFLQVAKQLIHLYETVPNSGMGGMLNQGQQAPPDVFSSGAGGGDVASGGMRLTDGGKDGGRGDGNCQC